MSEKMPTIFSQPEKFLEQKQRKEELPPKITKEKKTETIPISTPESIKNKEKTTPEIIEFDKETSEYVDKNGNIYGTIGHWKEIFGFNDSRYLKRRVANLNSIKIRDVHNNLRNAYNRTEIENIVKYILNLPTVDKKTNEYLDKNGEIYMSFTSLADNLDIDGVTLKKYCDKDKNIFIEGKSRAGRISRLYNVREVKKRLQHIIDFPNINKNINKYIDKEGKVYVSRSQFEKDFGITDTLSSKYLKDISSIKVRDRTGNVRVVYNEEELIKKVKDYIQSPQIDENGRYIDKDGKTWVTLYQFKKDHNYYIRKSWLVGQDVNFIKGKGKNGVLTNLYNPLDLLKIFKERESFKKNKKQEEEQIKQVNLKSFAEEVLQGETLQGQEFRQLINLFGGSRAADLLYRYRPEYSGVPVERVKKILAEYLGEFLLQKPSFNIDDIKTGLNYLSDQDLKEDLFELIKDNGLVFYNQKRKSGAIQNAFEILKEYTEYIKDKTSSLKNEHLNEIIEKTKEYYLSLEKFKKPNNIVEFIKEERPFPDFYQLINIKEIVDKNKLLIADEMGVGKSASVILAKEYLGLKQALVVVPSNVINTWADYLSDKTSEKGEQIGYFKKETAPKVLIIENLNSLKNIETAGYDYILVSQEKLKDDYVKELKKINYDFLIVDEVHKLKNILQGKRAEGILKLAEKIEREDKYLALLSGTPAPNYISDIALILKLLYPEKFKNIRNKELTRSIIYGEELDLRTLLIRRAQMKSLADAGESIIMPKLEERILEIELSEEEKKVYEVLMEEDEITAPEKIRILRQFLLNPKLLNPTPNIESSKISALSGELNKSFKEKDKIVVFFNGYIENVIRGEKSIISKLKLPEDIEVMMIEADTSPNQRKEIQKELKESDKKILLLVSGQTADVGVDFSGGNGVYFYNEPWTKYDYKQQLARVYRPGLKEDLKSAVFIVKGSIEEGIHKYIEIKEKAIEKLLRNIPRTDLENRLLEKSEKQRDPNLEVNPRLAEYYFSSWDRMMKIFAYVKGLGEEDFKKFLSEFGEAYANCYLDLGTRSYQANANRVVAAVLDSIIQTEKTPAQLKILDIASGPEMLKKHIKEEYQDKITSLDINEYHFKGKGGKRVVGGFSKLPFKNGSFDYTSLSLALHYTKFLPSRKEYERLEVLSEINRILKIGGKAALNFIYSLDFKNAEAFRNIVKILGFEVLENYSGQISEKNYESKLVTLRKVKDINLDRESLIEKISRENLEGLKFINTKVKLKNSRKIIEEFNLAGRKMRVFFNQDDFKSLEEEKNISKIIVLFKKKYKNIEKIPDYEIIKNKLIRIFNGRRYILFKKMETGDGYIVQK